MLNLTQKWGQPVVRPAVASADLVEVGIVVAPGRGTVLPLINWQMTPETDLELRLDNASGWCATHIMDGVAVLTCGWPLRRLPMFENATLASTSAAVEYTADGASTVFKIGKLS